MKQLILDILVAKRCPKRCLIVLAHDLVPWISLIHALEHIGTIRDGERWEERMLLKETNVTAEACAACHTCNLSMHFCGETLVDHINRSRMCSRAGLRRPSTKQDLRDFVASDLDVTHTHAHVFVCGCWWAGELADQSIAQNWKCDLCSTMTRPRSSFQREECHHLLFRPH